MSDDDEQSRTPWQVGDVHYAIFLRDHTYHEPRRTGVVTGVGRAGITVRLDKPNHEGKRIEQWPFHATPQFRTLEEAEAWCCLHPEPNVGRAAP